MNPFKIDDEIKRFKQDIYIKLWNPITRTKISNNYVYLRLSAINNQLSKEEQVEDTMNKLKADYEKLIETYPNLLKEGFELFVEVKSAYKNKERPEFIKLYNEYLFEDLTIKDLLEDTGLKEEKNLYIASYDRLSRVFFYSLTFQLIRKLRNINVFTTIEDEIQFENKYKEVKEEENMNQTMFVFQIMMLSSMSAKHSEDMSNKIKRRVLKTSSGTFSTKSGKRWGASKTISNNVRKKIIERFKSFEAKDIIEQSDIFQTKNGKKEKISINTLRKIIQENKKK